MPHRIRPAVPGDAALVVDLIRGLAEYEGMLDQVQATEASIRASLFPEGGPPAAYCVIGELDGEPAGFALYFYSYSTFLATPGPAFRGHGLGKALLLHLARIARTGGCGRMEWAVLDWNTPAIEFYEGLGARRMTEWQLCRLTSHDLAKLE